MTIKREYSILPQGEKDDFHHHVRDGRKGATSQYICLFTLTTVVIVLILTGVAILTASVFYSDQLTATYRHFWYSYESIMPNGTSNTSTSDDSSLKYGSNSKSTSAPHRDSTDYADQNNKTLDLPHRHHHHNSHDTQRNSSDGSSYHYSVGESDLDDSMNTTGGNDTSHQLSDSAEWDSAMNSTDADNIINMEQFKEHFAKAMRDIEKQLENITGVRKAEFVVPIFMLICFLTLFSLVSLCCCVLMRRRDNRRRKLFGKLITDLQTGDSKTVLLNHSDLDD